MDKRAKKITNLLKAPVKILDLGCGEGIVSRELLLLKKYFILAIDKDERKLKKLTSSLNGLELKGEIKVVCEDYLNYKFDDSFDLVMSFASLDHLNSIEQAKEMIQRLQKITNKNGYHFISVHIGDSTSNLPSKFQSLEDLENLYSDWEILEFDTLNDGKLGKLCFIIARKNK